MQHASTVRTTYRRLTSSALVALCLLLSFPVESSAAESTYRPGELIVQAQSEADLQKYINDFGQYNMRVAKQLSRRMNIWLLEYEPGTMKTSEHGGLLEVTRAHPQILKAQFNHPLQQRTTFPNDPSFGVQWALHNTGQSGGTNDADIDAPEAWDFSTGGITALGDQVVVAIIDGGYDLNHEDVDYFKNTLETPGNGIDDDGNGYVDDYDGWDAYSSDGTIPVDDHGMHVAGIAGAIGNNGIGIAGVNWGAKIMPIAGSSTLESTVIEAYGYVLEMRASYNETNGAKGAFVVSTNASFGLDFGDPNNFPLWCGIYDSLGAVGVLNAGATANLGINIDVQGDVPTACPSDYMVSVTNTTRTDARNSGAAWGLTTIDLGAPGTSVYSTTIGNTYGNKTGTSMATPQVAGAIGLMYSAACPGLLQAYRTDPGTVALQMKQYLLDGTDPNASLAGQTVSGGRLNVYNSIVLSQQFGCGLEISHTPLSDTKDAINDYEVLCDITASASLVPSLLQVHYEINAIEQIVLLTATGIGDEYHAFIPAQPAGTEISYWISAEALNGDADTTDTFAFRVIDYDPLVTPSVSMTTVPALDTAWHDFSVTNNGVFSDEFLLSAVGQNWITEIFDATGTSVISTTGSLAVDATLDFRVRVLVPVSMFGDVDTSTITATSVGNPAISANSIVQTTSTGGLLTIPFYDGFPDPTVDIGLWLPVTDATVNDVGLNEPSSPYSANFNGDPSGADTLTSHAIDLGGLSGLALSYAYQRTGGGESVDANDDLFVEYFNDLGQWLTLSQHLGADDDMSDFNEVALALPADAYHAAFSIRFRNIATVGAFDDWFVDDVRIDYPAEAMVTPTAISEALHKPESTSVALMVTNVGQGTLDYNVTLQPRFAPSSPPPAPARRAHPEEWSGLTIGKGQADPREGIDQLRGAGGPDGFGYVWVDSDEPGGPSFVYEDISGTGTAVTGLADDNSVGPFSLSFNFPYYGSSYTEIYISSNGLIGIGSDVGIDATTNATIPSSATPNNILAWMWDDLDPSNTSHASDVYIDSDTNRCIIQFTDIAEFGASGAVTAQVVLFSNGTIEYRYYSFNGGMLLDEATVGIENSTGSDGIELVFNANYLHDILLVRFSTPALWLTVEPSSGSVPQGQSAVLTAWLQSADLDTGLFYYDIEVHSNDPDPGDNPWVVPVTLLVTDCNCPNQADYQADGFIDAVDLNSAIGIIFFGDPDTQTPGCSTTITDFNNDGFADALDLNALIEYVFFGAEGPCDPCNPVQGTCAP